jgi:hypothetical protein
MRRYEAITVFLLLVGGVLLPVVGWLIGATMLLASSRWSIRDKLAGLLVWPGGLAPATALVAFAPTRECVYVDDAGGHRHGGHCTGTALSGWLGVPLLVVAVVGPLLTAAYLVWRARRPT